MSFFIFDITFFGLFVIFVVIFLYKNRKRVDREGILFLYRTKWGMKIIDKFAKKYSKLLSFFAIISILFGYIFMILAIYFLITSLRLMYQAVSLPKTPPIMPVIPYFTSIFKISFLPPLYFTYWILIIVVIAISHEFAHGVFARFYNIKIKSTGFGFLGPFIAAFVEPDEKSMQKKKIKNQLAILSAGSFANFLVAIIFILVMQLFFLSFYDVAGIGGWFYAIDKVNITNIKNVYIEGVGNVSVEEFLNYINNFNETNIESFNKSKIYTENNTYIIDSFLLFQQIDFMKKNKVIIAYIDSPAYNANLSGAISEIDGKKISSIKDIGEIISKKVPGDNIYVKTFNGTDFKIYNITLGKNPSNASKAFLGISYVKPNFVLMFFLFSFPKFNPYIIVKPKYQTQFLDFFKDLFYWLILIAISVALFNMLPFSFLDGGRVSYLTFLLLFKEKKKALKAYSIFNFLILILILMMFVIWFFKI